MTTPNLTRGNSHLTTTTEAAYSPTLRTSKPSVDPNDDFIALDQMAARFMHLLHEVDVLLADQEQRSAELAATADSAIPEQLKSSMQQFLRMRTEWEQERQHQLARLQKDQAELTAAWQRVESEERKLLSQPKTDRKPAVTKLAEELPVSNPLPSPIPAESAAVGANSSDAMLLQYQRMRREMQKHSQKNRR
ncbi:MAG: hypothetical protein O2931_09690 [Planctomycetota bacterium]|nr:hypothetical protein [Planctomycetota bacterium]MDA1179052.1 hypothetical protein [Planctomycetota bacterium]